MKIHIIRQHVTQKEIQEMLEELETYIKLAVDVERNILAGEANITPTVKRCCWKMEAYRKIFGAWIGIPKLRE
jgi:hypothetical protein